MLVGFFWGNKVIILKYLIKYGFANRLTGMMIGFSIYGGKNIMNQLNLICHHNYLGIMIGMGYKQIHYEVIKFIMTSQKA